MLTIPFVDADVAVRLELYRYMVLSRAIEDRLHRLHAHGVLRGRLISGRGQEAIPVGATSALLEGDVVAPVHRDLGAHLVRGTTPLTVFRHYLGRATSPSGGHDGDIHMGEWERGVFPMVSHLPDSWPVMCGVALARRLAHDDGVALAFCGDGATSTGTWHESVNFAAVFDLPLVLVVENNRYAYSTPTERQFRVRHLVDRAAAYGIEGIRVDGNDVDAVRDAAAWAVDRARRGEGPTLIEADTMRIDGHAVHDGADYVPADLVAEWRSKDPIDRTHERLVAAGVDPDDLVVIRAAQAQIVADALELALTEPEAVPGDGPEVYAT
jgi:TPP-dependent pyruvate/acetoin dehydrogenase alpha subunit